ncbi:hypothetical protein ABPG75_000780 [Micractinium tetrahymenae]
MPWQLDEFLAERVARARCLLAESEEHRGSTDMAEFVEAMQLTERLHRLILDKDSAVKPQIEVQEAVEVEMLVAPPVPSPWRLLAGVAGTVLKSELAAEFECFADHRASLEQLAEEAASLAASLESPGTAAELEAALAAAGLGFDFTASQALQACLLVQSDSLNKLSPSWQQRGAASAEQVAAYAATHMVPVVRRLIQAQPDRPVYHLQLASMTFDLRTSAALLRTAVHLAAEQREPRLCSTMRWQLDEFLAERVERARRLLAESPEHRGSIDMAEFVEAMDLVERLHHLLLDDTGHIREGASLAEQREALAAFVRIEYLDPADGVTTGECLAALEQAAGRVGPPDDCEPDNILPWHLLAMAATAMPSASLAKHSPHSPQHRQQHETFASRAGLLADCLSSRGTAAELDAVLSSAGLGFELTASQVRQVCLLAQLRALETAVTMYLGDEASERQRAAVLVQRLAPVARRLVAADRSRPSYHLRLALLSEPARAAGSLRTAVQLASEQRAHWRLTEAAFELAKYMLAGAEGRRVSRQEVQQLLQQGQRAQRLCHPWLPAFQRKALARAGAAASKAFEAAAAAVQPGQDILPAADSRPAAEVELKPGLRCDGCSDAVPHLRNRQCQVRHWKEGGHKQECAQLAAARWQRSGGAGSSAGRA